MLPAKDVSPDRAPAGTEQQILLRGLSRRYPGVVALNDFDLEVKSGEVAALVGENGAGKSTVVKLLSGAEAPDSGTIEVGGVEITGRGPRASRSRGIRVVYQELTIVPELSAIDNVFLGGTPRAFGVLPNRGKMECRYRELSEILNVGIHPRSMARDLSVADCQSLEIMRALRSNARMIILDEPTASISISERQRLYAIVRELSRQGVSIVFISHDLDEVLEISDSITVLRAGRRVAVRATKDWTKGDLVQAMLGRAVDGVKAPSGRAKGGEGKKAEAPLLDLRGLKVFAESPPIGLQLFPGEILGLAGLVGAGRSTLLGALAGAFRASAGDLYLEGERVGLPRSPHAAAARGIVLSPEDRKAAGLVLSMDVCDNVNLPYLRSSSTVGLLSKRTAMRRAQEAAVQVGLPAPMLGRRASSLSGGNQQKAVLAKWAGSGARVFLVDEPTRGVDIGAKQDIFAFMRSLADRGAGVIFVSSELDEVVANSDRVLALRGRQVVAELEARTTDMEEVLGALFGHEPQGPTPEDIRAIHDLVATTTPTKEKEGQ